MNNRKLVLENGQEFIGTGFGSLKEMVAEIIYNTAVVGYQEIISDPANTAKMICIIREGEYKVSYKAVDVAEISNKEKIFPKEWILDGNDIADEFFTYITPLVTGEVNLVYENGMIKYLKRK